MTRMYMNNNFMMDHDASACVAAAGSCAHMSAMSSAANMITLILDAIFMASIMICLICCLIAAAFLRICQRAGGAQLSALRPCRVREAYARADPVRGDGM